jgi:hypothetical protein
VEVAGGLLAESGKRMSLLKKLSLRLPVGIATRELFIV